MVRLSAEIIGKFDGSANRLNMAGGLVIQQHGETASLRRRDANLFLGKDTG